MRFFRKSASVSAVDSWWDYFCEHSDTYAYGFWWDYDSREYLHNADKLFPLASAIKVYHLLVYAVSVVNGMIDPAEEISVAEWEKYYFPADGGAHKAALKFLGIPYAWDTGRAKDQNTLVSVRDLMRVMIRLSDSAAPDYLWFRFGEDYFYRILNNYGIKNTILGSLLGSYLHFLKSESSSENAARLAERFLTDAQYRTQALKTPLQKYRNQERIALTYDPMGTVNDLLHLYRMISDLNPDPIMQIMQENLEFTDTGNKNIHIGGKGGSLPSIITNVIYIRRQEEIKERAVGILLTKALPRKVYFKELRSFGQQSWIFDNLHKPENFA